MEKILSINLEIKREFYKALQDPISRSDIEQLGFDIDAAKFGPSSTMAAAIDQGGADGKFWKPLSPTYKEMKQRYLNRDWPGETVAPTKVISTDIWKRTGKSLTFTKTKKSGEFKKLKITPRGFATGRTFFEVFIRKIDYMLYANEKRPLIFWYNEDKAEMQRALNAMVGRISARFNLDKSVVRRASIG